MLLLGCEPGSAPLDAGACRASWSIEVGSTDSADLVVVVHGAGLSGDERARLGGPVVRGIQGLLDGDLDRDGILDVVPYRSLRVGVVSADVGDEGGLSGCTTTGLDGRFVGCGSAGWETIEGPADDAVLERIACAIDRAATTTCPRARPIEALSLALLSPPEVIAGRAPHGSSLHTDFLRPHAALGLVVVSPVDDCSGELSVGADAIEVRCTRAIPSLLPIDTLLALPESPVLFRASVLGGYAEPASSPTELDALAAIVPEIAADGSIVPGCAREGVVASPAPRAAALLASLARGGAGTHASPLCALDTSWTTPLVELIAPALSAACLRRPIDTNVDGSIACSLAVTLPPPEGRVRWPSCSALGLTSLGVSVDVPGGEICVVPQAPLAEIETATTLVFAYDDHPEPVGGCVGELVLSIDPRDLDAGSWIALDCASPPADGGVCEP